MCRCLRDVAFEVSNMLSEDDALVLGVRFSANESANVYTSTWGRPQYDEPASCRGAELIF